MVGNYKLTTNNVNSQGVSFANEEMRTTLSRKKGRQEKIYSESFFSKLKLLILSSFHWMPMECRFRSRRGKLPGEWAVAVVTESCFDGWEQKINRK